MTVNSSMVNVITYRHRWQLLSSNYESQLENTNLFLFLYKITQ